MSTWRNLTLRLVAPILVLITLFRLIRHFSVVDMIGYDGRQRADEDLKSFSREIFGDCDHGFEELMQSRKLDDPVAARIRPALTMRDPAAHNSEEWSDEPLE